MPDLRPAKRTTELWGTIATGAGSIGALFVGANPTSLAFAISAVCAGYIISRSRYKRNRAVLQYPAIRSTEFRCLIAGQAAIWGLTGFGADIDVSVALSGGLQAIWNWSRGVAKSLPDTNTKVHVIR